jgi:hypothetical protein
VILDWDTRSGSWLLMHLMSKISLDVSRNWYTVETLVGLIKVSRGDEIAE